ncbi:unknown [Prevotella sp. CAG:924]|nr:unknown [Prevotella sp. CAG:924]
MMSYELEPGKRKEKQYGFYLTVYFLRIAFCKVSTVSVYKKELHQDGIFPKRHGRSQEL